MSLLERAIACALAAGAEPLVVLGAEADRLAPLAKKAGARAVVNSLWRRGLGTSIRVGVEHLDSEITRVLLMACDQPLVPAAHLRALLASTAPVAASRYAGTLGIPAAFARARFGDLLSLGDEEGAKGLLAGADEFPAPAAADDIDTPAQLAEIAGKVARA